MDKLNYILDSLPHYYKKEENSNIYNILSPIARQLDNFIVDLDKVKESKFIDLAQADDLDKIGQLINLKRIYGENDEAYRGRIKTTISSFIGGGTVEAINNAVKKYIGVEPTIIEHYKPGQGHAFFDTGIVNGLNVERLIDTVNDYRVNSGAFYRDGKRYFLNGGLLNPNKSGYIKYTIIDSEKEYLETFDNKIAGSVIENPHSIYYYDNFNNDAEIPYNSTEWKELNQTQIDAVKTKDSAEFSFQTQLVNGAHAAIMVSYDLVKMYERIIGKIPKETLAEKIQWVKDNMVDFNILAKGTGRNGTGYTSGMFAVWDKSGYPDPYGWMYYSSDSIWFNEEEVVSYKVSENPNWKSNWIMDDGKIYFLINTNASSDGITPVSLHLDYIKFKMILKNHNYYLLDDNLNLTENQFNLSKLTSLSGTTDYKGKHLDDPNNTNFAKSYGEDMTAPLAPPDGYRGTMFTSSYENIETLGDDWYLRQGVSGAGRRAELLCAFDLIGYFEKKYGTISGDKIAWIKSKTSTLKFNWWGYAEKSGKFVTLMPWNNTTASWDNTLLKENREQVSKLIEIPITSSNIANYIDNNGFVYFIAYANESTLATDYASLQIEENIFELEDIRVILNTEEHYITNTASITVQIPYDFNNSNISLEDVKDILRNTKAAGIALLIKVTDTYQDTATLQDTATSNFIVGVSGVGGNNTLGGA